MSNPAQSSKFDFIFTGAGCAALSLLLRMIKSGKFSEKKILLIDKAPKTQNDRTWCFWEAQNGFFESVVQKCWDQLDFYTPTEAISLAITPYRYKMIRGIDFYNYCFQEIRRQKNIEIVYGEVASSPHPTPVVINRAAGGSVTAEGGIIFNSIYRPVKQEGTIELLQHFKGWIIETPHQVFNPAKATLMDFRVSQEQGTTFAYTLPLTERTALVEYTLFTGKLLEPEQYDESLRNYIRDFLKIDEYRISEREFGVIPMTNQKFSFYKDGVYHIGTAGGQTKASSGYTFQFIQKQSEQILAALIAGQNLSTISGTAQRFHFYDTILLRLLNKGNPPGAEIFSKLFQRNQASSVFKFLDNQTSITEELKLICTLPTLPFLKAAMGRI